MSFNLDDPLAGILSDGSDDSFFDDDILGKKKPTKKKSTPIAEKKTALFDVDTEKAKSTLDSRKNSLFDIESDSKKPPDEAKPTIPTSPFPSKRIDSFRLGNDANPKPRIDANKSPAKSKVSASADKLDLLSVDLRKESKQIEKGKSSQSLLDDILGGPSTKSTGSTQAGRPVTAAKSQDFDLDSFLAKGDSKQIASTKSAPQKNIIIPKVEKPKEDSAPSKKKTGDDWLGIFEDKDDDVDEQDGSGMPAWLMSGDSSKKKSVPEKKPPKQIPEAQKEKEEVVAEEKIEKEMHNPVHVVTKPIEQLGRVPSVILHNSTEDITAEGASLYLQQQESQLMVAMQLKAQEEKLAAMQMRQKETQRVQREAAEAHHAQLDAMLQRQAVNRQQMQAIIAAHQESITQRIRALLNTQNMESDDGIHPANEYETIEGERRESPYVQEKKQLLQLVRSLQENHDKEIDLMETSYRRQLAFVEVSLNQSEERMKEESEKLVKFYSEKIRWLEEHHLLYKKLSEDNLNSLTERHKAENEMLRQQQEENVRVLQEHHTALMENIKNAVKHEQVIIQDSAGFSTDLHALVTDVRENKTQCQQLVEKVQTLADNTQLQSERSLKAREAQVTDMIQQLKRERDNLEIEKTENRDLVKMLEARLKQMMTMIEEDSTSLRQKRMEFEFEKATFSKQTEFAKSILKKQDEEMKILREDIQKEYQEKIAKIDEERSRAVKDSAVIAKEKASVQSLRHELEKLKAELQAQLEEVAEERTKMNVEKQQMHLEEQRILAKSRDLDLLAKTAIEKQTQADKKYSEAEFIQRKYEERIRRIQEHVASLNSREKQIAKEKVSLSRERLSLHNEKKQMESRRQCSLCKSTQNFQEYNLEPTYNLPDSFLNVSVSRDYTSANIPSAVTAIEQEMTRLVGTGFNIRPSTEFGPKEDYFSNIQMSEDVQDSGAFKDYMDPKFMMLRLDVQKVLSNLDQNKNEEADRSDGNEHAEDR